MNLGVQYYRAPFPFSKYWADDFARIKDSGFNTVQLWVLWAWVEAKPGVFNFDDYDRLVELADKKGLGVVLSAIGEVQPHWIHDEVPGSEMIDHMGHKVISSIRLECHFGLTPGGCTDHPGVWERMATFLEATAHRYKDAPNLVGWDAWNELRWSVHSDGYVCYCGHTLREYRKFLDQRHGGLDGLNRTWMRRYNNWGEVMPGKMPVRPFTEMMSFQHFLTMRANEHGRLRCEVMKKIDPAHAVTVHPAAPCPLEAGGIGSSNPHLVEYIQAINRGNDWFFADVLDGIGCSSFPKWGDVDDTDFSVRMRFMTSAARGKRMWLSELQAAASVTENRINPPVEPREQQRWLWQGIAAGADTVLFWCWRDEVFGREAGAFGIAGNDGFAEQRLAQMKRTGALLREHESLLKNYRPDGARVGVFFSPQSYYLNWSQEGNAEYSMNAVQNYCRALSRLHVPYIVVEEEHLEALDGLDVLFLPRVQVLDDKQEKALEAFVARGGVLFTESECGAWDSRGLWRYPEDRLVARLTGVKEVGRRPLSHTAVPAIVADRPVQLPLFQWITPLEMEKGSCLSPWQDYTKATSLLSEVPVGKGCVFLCGTFLGNGVSDYMRDDFDALVDYAVRSAKSVRPVVLLDREVLGESAVQIISGTSNGERVVFLFAPEGCPPLQVRLASGYFPSGKVTDLFTGRTLASGAEANVYTLELDAADYWGVTVLRG